MKKLLFAFTIMIAIWANQPATALAAQFYGGQSVSLTTNDHPTDAYIAGRTVDINTPATGDLNAAGSSVNIQSTVENSLNVAGGTVVIGGEVKQTAHVAGGDVTINGQMDRDLLVAGGNVTLTSTATIQGDLIVAGGTVQINAPVHGKVIAYGGNVTINSKVDGNIEGQIETLTLSREASIGGDVHIRSNHDLIKSSGATIHGKTTVDLIKPAPIQPANVLSQTIYGLISGLIITLLLLYLFKNPLTDLLAQTQATPFKMLVWGACLFILAPIVMIILLPISVWLSLIIGLLYGLFVIISWFIAQIYLGYWFLKWWENRNRHPYTLDWRAGVIGAIAAAILLLVPVLGWLVMFFLWLLAFGSLAHYLRNQLPSKSPAA